MDPEGDVEEEGAPLFVDTPNSSAGSAIEGLTDRLIEQLREASSACPGHAPLDTDVRTSLS